jgi:pyrimidine-specific ribonucleoside hydrolase
MNRACRQAGSQAAPSALTVLIVVVAGVVACSTSPTSGPPAGTGTVLPAPSIASGEPIPLVIDTDMAPDDIVAIASLLRDPAVHVMAITVVGTGEAHCEGGMFVARAVVTTLVPDPIPVACGPPEPLGEAQPFPDAWRAGADAGNGLALVSPTFAPDPRPAAQILNELAISEAADGRRLRILTLGTLTNVAAAVELDPALPERVTLFSMLGAIDVPGNVTPDVTGMDGPAVAEWNAHADPTAVRIVLEAGFDWTLIPLDATNSTPLTDELYRELEADTAAGPADLVFELWSKNSYMRSAGYYLWDPLAAAALRDPSLVETREATLRVVEGAGLDGGQLIEDPAGAHVTVATAADRAAFEALLLARLRIGPPRENAFVQAAALNASDGTGGQS